MTPLLKDDQNEDLEMAFTENGNQEDFELEAVREEARIMVERERAQSFYQGHNMRKL